MSDTNVAGPHDSPLGETLKLVDPERYHFDLKLGPSEGAYETVHSLARVGGTDLARRMEMTRAKWGLSNRDAALFMIGTYVWGIGGPAIACYALSRRVPDVSPANVALRFDADGGLSEAALLHERFAVLPSDVAASHPQVVVLDGEAEMLAWMRERLVSGIEPLLDAVRGHAHIGRRAVWRNVSDFVASAFLMVGWDAGDQARHAADAEAFLTAPSSPMRNGTSFFVVEQGGRRGAYVTRAVCCQAYKEPEEDNCDSCPMLSQNEREHRALADLAARE